MSVRPPQPSSYRSAAAVALLAIFVLAQTLGWMHRGFHASSGTARHTHSAVLAQVAAVPHDERSAWIASLFGNHQDPSDCRLFDFMGQPGCLPSAVPVPANVPSSAFLAASHADFVVRWTTLFDARGPPSSR